MLDDFDLTEDEVSVPSFLFLYDDKVSTCSVISIEPRMRCLSLEFLFFHIDKVSTCSAILIGSRMRFLSLVFIFSQR